ncbi:MAG: low molecular weight phosphotyrosine protein phosphatase, partial [Bdellovibrionales bacterium]|nr:low molecular weight phosphotyrosine protein phosphatase [Bdellovibrionales bacterium]
MATHRILFVCLGNICRSPLAEGVLRKLVQDAGREQDFEIASCGTGSWHVGKPPHQGTLNLAHRYQLPLDGKRARVLCSADFTEYDLLVALDRSNYHDIRSVAKGIGAKL